MKNNNKIIFNKIEGREDSQRVNDELIRIDLPSNNRANSKKRKRDIHNCVGKSQ